eukprot:Anaeramoba_ignava/c17920_g1_i1.p2 GENE.c17920_g1_i1~~c17920_g1_i1.p2  ORF type:complete len:141 (-),score=27.51 c17920_g1_i1:21-443(-)
MQFLQFFKLNDLKIDFLCYCVYIHSEILYYRKLFVYWKEILTIVFPFRHLFEYFHFESSRDSRLISPSFLYSTEKHSTFKKNYYTKTCTVCRCYIKGLGIFCTKCGHGGHKDHIRKWFENHKECPTGCGCQCEFQNLFTD